MPLSCRDTTLTEPQQIHLFITGLGNPLRTEVALMQSATLADAVIFTRGYEQRSGSIPTTTPPPPRSSTCSIMQPVASALTPSTASSVASSPATAAKPVTTLQLSPAEWHLTGTCFCCNEKFTPGHRKECKQLFVIEVLCDNYE
jgi:hypothetical protein